MAETHSTAAPRRGRGRPLGSGIDDADLLDRVRDVLRADPLLKSTTAIKRIGISDPSIIRRLRDKLQIKNQGTSAILGSTPLGSNVKPHAIAMTTAPVRPTEHTTTKKADVPTAQASDAVTAPETEQQKRLRSALLLAAYLEALAKSTPQTSTPSPESRPADPVASVAPKAAVAPEPPPATEQRRDTPPIKAAPAQDASGPHSGIPFNFPGMPPFLQPFRHTATNDAAKTTQANRAEGQLEGMKLAVEAMTTMTKLQLHITENAMTYSPMALMLQGQAFLGQMLLASFTGQLDATKKKSTDLK